MNSFDQIQNEEYLPMGSLLCPELIPNSMKGKLQWAPWVAEKNVKKPDRPNKVARQARNYRFRASSTNPSHWGTFDEAYKQLAGNRGWFDKQAVRAGFPDFYGLAFVLLNDDDTIGIDLDSVLNPVTGEIVQWALDDVRSISSYTELSPSKTGLRIFARGELSFTGRSKGNHDTFGVEIYSSGRYLTVTGDRFNG